MRNLFLIALLSFGLYSCSNEEVDPVTTLDSQLANRIETDCATILDLKAGQNFVAGTVTVTNDESNVYVTYQTNSEWELNEVQLYVGLKSGMPLNTNGSPKIGQFPINFTNLYQKTFTTTIPIVATWWDLPQVNEICPIVVAAHAVVSKTDGIITTTETAWSEGERFTKNNWGMFSDYCLKIDCTPPVECPWTNETAFGGATMGGGNAWWYYYENNGQAQPIYAGKKQMEGASVQYLNGQIFINLGTKMELAPGSETVKIEGYNIGFLPTNRQPAGHFTYKGNALTVNVAPFDYYIIHLDVKVENCIVPVN